MGLTFCGREMWQTWTELEIWEELFNTVPLKLVIELGTGAGGFALFLALQCAQHGAQFWTLDQFNNLETRGMLESRFGLASRFIQTDTFAPATLGWLKGLLGQPENHPACLFFDDGDKPREWKTFAPLAWSGDILVAHDWGTEFQPEDVGNIPVERILTGLCDRRTVHYLWSMWFRKLGSSVESLH